MANDGRSSSNTLYPEYAPVEATRISSVQTHSEYDQANKAAISATNIGSEYDQQGKAAVAGTILMVEYGQNATPVRRPSGYIPFQGWNFPILNRNFQGSKGRTKWGQWTPKGQEGLSGTIEALTALLGLTGWTYYDASVGVTYDGSSRASAWEPAAGDTPAAIFTQPDAAQRPFAGNINGKPALYSGATPTGWMDIPNAVKWSLPTTGGGAIYTIARDTATLLNTAGNGLLGDLTGTAGMSVIAQESATPGFARTGLRLNAGTAYVSTAPLATPLNRGVLIGFDRDATTSTTRINENVSAPVATGTYAVSTSPLKVFRYNEDTSSVPYGLFVGGILAVRHGLTPATAFQVRQVLYQRWGIS